MGTGFFILLLLAAFNVYFFNITQLDRVVRYLDGVRNSWLSFLGFFKIEEKSILKTDENMKSVIAKVKEEVALEDKLKAEKKTEVIPKNDSQAIELSVENRLKKEYIDTPALDLIVEQEKKKSNPNP